MEMHLDLNEPEKDPYSPGNDHQKLEILDNIAEFYKFGFPGDTQKKYFKKELNQLFNSIDLKILEDDDTFCKYVKIMGILNLTDYILL